MESKQNEPAVTTLHVVRETLVAAPAAIVFATVLQPHGPLKDMKLKLEPWPGGRWYRDLGGDAGHLWGHVQVIKPPTLLEVVGPMMMSFPVASHLQYRLTEQAGGVLLTLTHRAVGLIPPNLEGDVTRGWGEMLEAVRAAAEGAAR